MENGVGRILCYLRKKLLQPIRLRRKGPIRVTFHSKGGVEVDLVEAAITQCVRNDERIPDNRVDPPCLSYEISFSRRNGS